MLQLFLDTSTHHLLVGLAFKEEVLDVKLIHLGLQNSKFLFPALLDLLNKNQYTPKDLELIGCGVGPGSYTGIRAGAALAKSMAYALRLPLVGISSLECYIPSKVGPFAVMLDAKYGGVYFQKGMYDGTKTTFDSMPEVSSLNEIQEKLKDIPLVVTPERDVLKERLENLNVKWEEAEASPACFAGRVYENFLQGNFNTRAELKLHYLRKTQAEYEKEDLA